MIPKSAELVKATQSDRLMTSFDRFQQNGFLCDFAVEVGGKSFRVHRAVLAASSEYFEAMFSSNMKEVNDGHVNMKDVDQDGIAQCIEFMYKGKADLRMENIQHILQASHFLQMLDLMKYCFQYLQSHISPMNCLSVMILAETYNRQDVKELAEQVAVTDFKSVIPSQMFPSIKRSDLLRFLKNESYQTVWQAVKTWAKGNGDADISNFIVDTGKFPFKFILGTVLEDPLVKMNETSRNTIIHDLFLDVNNLENNLDIDNCFILKNLAESYQVNDPSTVAILIGFLESHFEEIVEKNEFCHISKNDVMKLLGSSNTKCNSEKVKWHAVIKWVKYDIQKRETDFQDLFEHIDLEKFPVEFLKTTVRYDRLVRSSEKCKDKLMDEVMSRAPTKQHDQTTDTETSSQSSSNRSKLSSQGLKSQATAKGPRRGNLDLKRGGISQPQRTTTPGLRIINQQPSEGSFSVGFLLKSLPGHSECGTIVITYLFPPGNVKGVSYEGQKFTEYLPGIDDKQEIRSLLERAFNAGILFKILEISLGRGQIIWNDEFPHKTNKTGGSKNNGYPDMNHVRTLLIALKAKKFQ
ncbi:uncharacterized protein LOC120330282 [Styela clava]